VLKEGTGWRFKKESSGGGVLIDIGIHVIDLLLLFFGKIKNVSTEKISFVVPEIDDSVTGLLRFENGLTCIFETSWNVKNYRLQETTLEINGTLGKIKVNEDYVKIQYFESDEESNEEILYRQSLYKGVHLDIGGSMYASEDADFVNCLENGTQPGSNVINSIQVQSVIDSIYKSSKSNKQEGVIYIE
jgi:predicted dehydrogenase